jgi:hypothetical protein
MAMFWGVVSTFALSGGLLASAGLGFIKARPAQRDGLAASRSQQDGGHHVRKEAGHEGCSDGHLGASKHHCRTRHT